MRVEVPAAVTASTTSANPADLFVVMRNGTDVTSAFTKTAAANTYEGLMTGLVLGTNNVDVSAKAADLAKPASLGITNYPNVPRRPRAPTIRAGVKNCTGTNSLALERWIRAERTSIGSRCSRNR